MSRRIVWVGAAAVLLLPRDHGVGMSDLGSAPPEVALLIGARALLAALVAAALALMGWQWLLRRLFTLRRRAALFALLLLAVPGIAVGDETLVTPGYIPTPLSPGPGSHPTNAEPVEVVVVRGDNMWKLAQRRIEEVSPQSEVSPYWRTVVAANRGSIRSGNPDLIYPGETLELPPLEARQP